MTTILFSFFSALSAQVTQKQADFIVLEHMSSETQHYIVYAQNEVQTEMTITTAKGEVLELDYSAWVYYIQHTEETNSKYLIVNENNGNLLEIKPKANAEPNNLMKWKIVEEERCFCIMDTLRGEWSWIKWNRGGIVGGTIDNEFKSIIKILSQNEDASINYEVFVEDILFYRGSFQIQEDQRGGNSTNIMLPHAPNGTIWHIFFHNPLEMEYNEEKEYKSTKNALTLYNFGMIAPPWALYERIK